MLSLDCQLGGVASFIFRDSARWLDIPSAERPSTRACDEDRRGWGRHDLTPSTRQGASARCQGGASLHARVERRSPHVFQAGRRARSVRQYEWRACLVTRLRLVPTSSASPFPPPGRHGLDRHCTGSTGLTPRLGHQLLVDGVVQKHIVRRYDPRIHLRDVVHLSATRHVRVAAPTPPRNPITQQTRRSYSRPRSPSG